MHKRCHDISPSRGALKLSVEGWACIQNVCIFSFTQFCCTSYWMALIKEAIWPSFSALHLFNWMVFLLYCCSEASLSGLAPLEAILFDIDGTLCDSDPFHYYAFREMLQEVWVLSCRFGRNFMWSNYRFREPRQIYSLLRWRMLYTWDFGSRTQSIGMTGSTMNGRIFTNFPG